MPRSLATRSFISLINALPPADGFTDNRMICTKFKDHPFLVRGVISEKISMLGFPGKIRASRNNQGLTIEPPLVNPATSPCDQALVFKISNAFPE